VDLLKIDENEYDFQVTTELLNCDEGSIKDNETSSCHTQSPIVEKELEIEVCSAPKFPNDV
jgi:hypothetical protein